MVAITPITLSTFTHSVDVQGRVDGDQNVTISPRASGQLVKIYLKAGSSVKAGQIIAEIDHAAIKAQINDLKANLELATQMYEKQKNLWEQKVGTEIQYLQAKTNKESLEAKLANAQEMQDMYLIKSPINGTLDDMSLKVGQMATAGQTSVRVVNLSELKVKADLAEAYAGAVKEGDPVNMYFPDIDKSATSTVAYSAKVINPTTRTFGIEIRLPGDNTFRPNMITEIHVVDYRKDNAVVVPINAVQQLDDDNIVYVAVQEGKKTIAKKVSVKTVKMYNGKMEILGGLKSGDQLITTGYQDLTDGEVIKF
jgi:RND family efflux transporter MFP subunit